MPVLGINRKYLQDFIDSTAPCLTVGLAAFEDEPVLFLGLKTATESTSVDVGFTYRELPNQSALQFHFIFDDSSYYYCFLDPNLGVLKKVLEKATQFNILVMRIGPSGTGSSALIEKGSDIHKNLENSLPSILACPASNDISKVEFLAEGVLGKMGTQIEVVCVDKEYSFGEDMAAVQG